MQAHPFASLLFFALHYAVFGDSCMAKRKLQINLEYLLARAILGFFGVLPRSVAIGFGRAMGRIAYWLPLKLRRTGERNLELAFPEMAQRDRQLLLRGCFDSLGRLLAEFSQFPRMSPERLRGMIEYDQVGLAHLRDAEKNKRGVIFLTGHLGAWELLSFGWSALEYPISFLVRPLDNERIEEMIERVRTRFGNQAIDKKSAARQALRVLRQGGTLGILSDLNTHPFEGVFVPFFGKLACTTAGDCNPGLQKNARLVPTQAGLGQQRKTHLFSFGPAGSR